VSTEWLAEHLEDGELRLLEVTAPGAGYAFGHIAGAVYLRLEEVLTGRASGVPDTVGPLDEVSSVLGGLGLERERPIVVYDEFGGMRSAQAFWLLEYLGCERVHLLEGGMERWLAEGRPTSSAAPEISAAKFTPRVRDDRLATAGWIAERLEDGGACLLDVRTPEEYTESHIPGALNRPWERTLTRRAYQAFRPAEELLSELGQLGATEGKEIVTYCLTGARSAHTYLTLRVLGYEKVRNYDGSWAEWGSGPDRPRTGKPEVSG
jgi:thiosulfate/3-mercaptopyruvate sulfurtransferase